MSHGAAGPRDTAAGGDWAVAVPTGYRVGPWEVVSPLASGNWGSVYTGRRVACGEDPDGGTAGSPPPAEVALKFVATSGLGPGRSRHLRELARREAEFSRTAEHPRLIRVLDTLVVADDGRPELDGAVVLVMERASGSLQDLLDAASGSAPLADATRTITQMCEGLAHLHADGWVHGDLKPANVLIMSDGSVRLADFGLVSRLNGTHGYAPPLGSPDYLPPERWQDGLGERGVPVRPTADIWALGVTTHQILTGGSLPFAGTTAGARTAAAQEYASGKTPLRLHPGLSDAWRDFVSRCLAPDHSARSSATAEHLLSLARRLSDADVQRRRTAPWRPAVYAVAAATVLAAGTTGGWWWFSGRDGDASAEADGTAGITVYNIEAPCRARTERLRACSMGLSLDPYEKYEEGNVSERRIWHGDVLRADCVVYDGDRVADETGVGTTRWYRVRVTEEPSGYAWFPAVRTKKEPDSLPTCGNGARSSSSS
ncbi:serine/threonine-protein kinase [Streptomyces sp. KMM 9044]|uniref:serine/threonine-protein kinase n=1 Tax=Streptomyces sp. KMM 9044 TaxID=2744474 RepID=UPI002151A178|nr:serine/threonine-protein kinase [Streptomyces sp. KMM 9044]WAX78996.1 serine/threonine-protein kinase [Streptomyces sp. KMM 9044]